MVKLHDMNLHNYTHESEVLTGVEVHIIQIERLLYLRWIAISAFESGLNETPSMMAGGEGTQRHLPFPGWCGAVPGAPSHRRPAASGEAYLYHPDLQ